MFAAEYVQMYTKRHSWYTGPVKISSGFVSQSTAPPSSACASVTSPDAAFVIATSTIIVSGVTHSAAPIAAATSPASFCRRPSSAEAVAAAASCNVGLRVRTTAPDGCVASGG